MLDVGLFIFIKSRRKVYFCIFHRLAASFRFTYDSPTAVGFQKICKNFGVLTEISPTSCSRFLSQLFKSSLGKIRNQRQKFAREIIYLRVKLLFIILEY